MNFQVFSKVIAALALVGISSEASALPLDDAAAVRPSFSVGDTDPISFDGSGSDAIKAFDSFTSSSFLSFGTITDSTSAGTTYEIYFLSEVAYYDGRQLPGSANSFGTVDGSGNYTIRMNSTTANPGTGVAATFTSNPGDQFTLAIQSPEGMRFSSVDSNNADGGAHIIGKSVTTPGAVTLQSRFELDTLLTFNLLAGDLVLFFEDESNSNSLVDFDYNDMVLVIRQSAVTAVPEPASMMLMLSGLGGAAAIRRRRKTS